MSKILYPKGSSVQIRDWKVDELRSEGRTFDNRKRVVAEYVKGEAKPYKLEGVSIAFSVDEIKSYRPGSSKVETPPVLETTAISAPQVQSSLTPCDVREIIREELQAFEDARSYQEAQAELQEYLNNEADASEKEDINMSTSETIRQKLMYAAKPKQERVLTEAGILQGGVLTEQGRRVVLDLIWEGDKDLQKAVFSAVEKLNKKSKNSKNSDDDEE